MASERTVKDVGVPNQIVFRDATDYGTSPTTAANNLETSDVTRVQLDLTGVADTAARQSTKADLGANRADEYDASACLEFDATPTAGEVVEVYWAPSNRVAAGEGNPGGVSGADGAYTGDSSNLAAAVKQLIHIGNFLTTEVAKTEGQQKANIGSFAPPSRFGSIVLKNESGASLNSTAGGADEMSVVLTPSIGEQA